MDTAKCAALKAELESQPEPAYTPLARFLDGNDDEGSLGCNLLPHPGMPAFQTTLRALLQRPDVKGAWAIIAEIDPGEDSWPFTDTIVVATTLSAETLASLVENLSPSDVAKATAYRIPQTLKKESLAAAKQPGPDGVVSYWAIWWD
jgi:hypothetical protein